MRKALNCFTTPCSHMNVYPQVNPQSSRCPGQPGFIRRTLWRPKMWPAESARDGCLEQYREKEKRNQDPKTRREKALKQMERKSTGRQSKDVLMVEWVEAGQWLERQKRELTNTGGICRSFQMATTWLQVTAGNAHPSFGLKTPSPSFLGCHSISLSQLSPHCWLQDTGNVSRGFYSSCRVHSSMLNSL